MRCCDWSSDVCSSDLIYNILLVCLIGLLLHIWQSLNAPAPTLKMQSDGVVDPTSSFAGVLLAWIASAITVELMQSSTSSARADKTSLSPDNQELNQI